ncbi:MAG: RNA-directed DNA polymerase [Proteobacteria bacterium]|nr:RNA-directed DNA polymerase [Pseudomonadota bacterium]
MSFENWTAWHLAEILIATDWTPQAMEDAARKALGGNRQRKWLPRLIADIMGSSPTAYAPSPRTVAGLILDSRAFRGLRLNDRERPLFDRYFLPAPIFSPTPAFRDLAVPELANALDSARWLNLSPRHLDWFADIEGYRSSAAAESTRHYVQAWIPKRTGPPRLIEAPKQILKDLQRKILREILDPVAVHDSAHGFRRGRSCITAAQLHAGEDMVITMDLKDFFPSVPIRSVHGIFRSLGYPWAVARLLTGLCSTTAPASLFDNPPGDSGHDEETRRLFHQRHLPQGAPTSPALANLCARRLDGRLNGLAHCMEARYTRYGDDLAFSGDRDFAARSGAFLRMASAICAAEGFAVNHRKTRIMRQGDCQRITGLTVNSHINVPRGAYDRLKAILHNCTRHGPANQNRENHPDFRAHLDGRITWVENVNPPRGLRLRLMFMAVEWG